MIFTKLKLNYFGRFTNREIELKPGINLIYGDNEAGKSTIHTFIRGMLFGIERLRGRGAASKEDIYTRYLPWDYPGAYGGSMDIKLQDKEYRIKRSFHANDKSFVLLDLSTGREVKLKEGLISELIPGLTEATYKNTVSIEQLKAATDAELAAEVRNYVTNLSIAKSKEVNVAQAVNSLTDQKKQLEASQNMSGLKALQAAIDEGIRKEEQLERLSLKLRELLAEEQTISEQKNLLQDSNDSETAKLIEQLPAVLEKYQSFQELNRQENNLKQQEQEIKNKIATCEKKQQAASTLLEDLSQLKQLQNRIYELEKTDLELQGEKERLNKRAGRNLLISILPGFVTALISIAVTGFGLIGMLLFAVLMLSGIMALIVLGRPQAKEKRAIRERKNEAGQSRVLLQTQLQGILKKYGVTRTDELLSRQEETIRNSYERENTEKQLEELKQRYKELEDRRDLIYETIMKYIQHFILEEELTDATIQRLQQVITDRLKEKSGKWEQLNRQQEERKLAIEKFRWQISALEGNEEELLKNKESYQELEEKHREAAVELEAVKLALNVIQELSTEIHDSFGQQLNTAVTKVISNITGQKYNNLKVDERLEVKVGWKDDYILLERLSAGTIDQIYFALRMAVSELLLGENEIPLLLDDSLALYDEKRVKACLKELSQREQVILFTCHRREQQLLKELGISFQLVELP